MKFVSPLVYTFSLLICFISLIEANNYGSSSGQPSYWVQTTPGADQCSIADLQMTGGATLTPSFQHSIKSYSCSCPTGSNTVNIKVRLGQADGYTSAILTVDGSVFQTLSSDQLSNPITLHGGTTTIQVSTSCNVCSSVYTIKCTRPETVQSSTGGEGPLGGNTGTPVAGGSVIGDPLFSGLRGQIFQVHGVANEVYNLISTPSMQMNSRFVFLNEGECAIINGKRQRSGCYSHPGSYLGEVAIKTSGNDRLHIVSGDAEEGFSSVTVNGKQLFEGDNVELRALDSEFSGSVQRKNSHMLIVELSKFTFIITNSDMFVNQEVAFPSISVIADQKAHGLLGQTWRTTIYPSSKIKEIEGTVGDYRTPDQDIWSDDFVYNRFGKE